MVLGITHNLLWISLSLANFKILAFITFVTPALLGNESAIKEWSAPYVIQNIAV